MRKTLYLICLLLLGLVVAACGGKTAQLGTADSEPESALLAAIGAGDLDAVTSELEANPDLLDQPEGRLMQTPLHKAVRSKRFEIIQFLVDSGADLNPRDAFGRSPLAAAMDEEVGNQIIDYLRDVGADD